MNNTFKEPLFFALLLILFSGLQTTEIRAQTAGYQFIKPQLDRQAADKMKIELLQTSSDIFQQATFTGDNGVVIRYRLLEPEKKDREQYPLIIIFPTSGGIGTDNTNQIRLLPKFWAQPYIRSHYPAYVVAIQFPERSSNYVKKADSLPVSVPAPCLFVSLQLINFLKNTLPVDTTRVYALGFSMGASTVNNAMVARPDLFAAGVCISGIPMQEGFELLKHIPLWVIHGNSDTENPITGDQVFFRRMSSFPDHHTCYWEIDGLEHEIYSPLYMADLIPKWLFSQKRKNR